MDQNRYIVFLIVILSFFVNSCVDDEMENLTASTEIQITNEKRTTIGVISTWCPAGSSSDCLEDRSIKIEGTKAILPGCHTKYFVPSGIKEGYFDCLLYVFSKNIVEENAKNGFISTVYSDTVLIFSYNELKSIGFHVEIY